MEHWIIQIVMRYVHIVSAILLVGGTAFIAMVMRPCLLRVEDGVRASVQKLTLDRFIRIVWIGITGLVISGVYNWITFAATYRELGPAGHSLIGMKVLLAMILFALVWANRIGLVKLTQRAYLMINLHLAAMVILIAVILRYLRLAHFNDLIGGGS